MGQSYPLVSSLSLNVVIAHTPIKERTIRYACKLDCALGGLFGKVVVNFMLNAEYWLIASRRISYVTGRFRVKKRIARSQSCNLPSVITGEDSFHPSLDSSFGNHFGILLEIGHIRERNSYRIIAFEGVDESLMVTEIDLHHLDYRL
jgi:hypothetical protein